MYNTFLRYSQNHQNQVYQPQSILTWHHFLQYLMWLTWLQLFELSHELIQLSLLVDIIVYWIMCLQELIYQGQIHLLKVSALFFFFFLCPSLSLSISLLTPLSLSPFFCCLLFLFINPPFCFFSFFICILQVTLPTTIQVNWKPFFTDLRCTWLGRLAKPT